VASDHLRNKIVFKLVEDIERLSGGDFEQFGYEIMRLLLPGRWEERGTTIDGAPRGYTVDTSSNGATNVGEMSSEAGYFEDMSKPEADLEHALTLHPDAKSIWLLSSRAASASQTTAIAATASSFRRKHRKVKNVEILDARAIATEIYRHIGRRDLVQRLSNALPTIERLADESAFSHAIPSVASLVERPTVEADIRSALASRTRVILQGMSGAGKTALAARVAASLRDSYDNVIWVDAHGITEISALSNIDVMRSGFTHNVRTLLTQDKILLVLDDPSFALSALNTLSQGQSKIIATAQAATGAEVIHVADVEEGEAAAILTQEIAAPCPEGLIASVRAAVGGHALVLRALNRLADAHGWQAVKDCLDSDNIAGLEDDTNRKVLRRILRRQAEELSDELALVRWVDAPRFHEEIATLVSTLAVNNLSKRGFLAGTSPGYVRVHDLVFRAIVAEVAVSDAQQSRLTDRMARLIRDESETDRLLLQRLARGQVELFKRLANDTHAPAFTYMVALARTGEDSIAILGDPWMAAGEIVEKDSLEDANLEIRSLIEVVEALNTLRNDYRPKKEAQSGLERDVAAFTLLLEHDRLSSEQRKMLRHHYAKMLIRLDRKAEAESIFRDLLDADPRFAAARLQLARILPKGADAIRESILILAQHDTSPNTVSLNVLLETLRVLALNDVDMTRHESLIMASIEHAGEMDLAVAVRVVSDVAQRLHFKAPELVLRIFKSIQWPALAAAPSDRFDWAQAHKFAAKAARNDEAVRDQFLNAAVDAYQQTTLTKPYHRTQFADALIELKRYEEANEQLELIPSDKMDPFAWQRKAQALRGVGDLASALAAIDSAINTLTSKDERYRPTFLADRSRIRRALDEPDALLDLERAIALLPEGDKHRNRLQEELDNARKSPQGTQLL
jgi:tetratricopeptide (TPR) repeat protein